MYLNLGATCVLVLYRRLEPLMVMGTLNKLNNMKRLVKLETFSTFHTHIENARRTNYTAYSTRDQLALHAAGFALFCYVLSICTAIIDVDCDIECTY
jgi:hypothetical protein